jgi:hypothetical protein
MAARFCVGFEDCKVGAAVSWLLPELQVNDVTQMVVVKVVKELPKYWIVKRIGTKYMPGNQRIGKFSHQPDFANELDPTEEIVMFKDSLSIYSKKYGKYLRYGHVWDGVTPIYQPFYFKF